PSRNSSGCNPRTSHHNTVVAHRDATDGRGNPHHDTQAPWPEAPSPEWPPEAAYTDALPAPDHPALAMPGPGIPDLAMPGPGIPDLDVPGPGTSVSEASASDASAPEPPRVN